MAERLTLRCATESLARDEPQIGTASRVRRWLIVEQPGAWGRDALTESHLPPDVGKRLADHARSHRVRVLLARRPGDMRGDGTRRVFLAHTGAERRWMERLDLPADEPERLVDLELGPLAFPDPPGIGAPCPNGVMLVCTNGRHDPCCADKGRPVVRALAAAGVADVWESSHVGGDRFAANVVSLPDGVYYGRVEPDEAADLVATHRTGTIDLGALPGAQPPAAAGPGRRPLRPPAPGRDAPRRPDRAVHRGRPRRDQRRAVSSGTATRSRCSSSATGSSPPCSSPVTWRR